ncbi:MAG: energy transducer TonB [Caulobacteraceae bacterium]|nr:energy transducer TonB [Caulobacteraceae bacterium]
MGLMAVRPEGRPARQRLGAALFAAGLILGAASPALSQEAPAAGADGSGAGPSLPDLPQSPPSPPRQPGYTQAKVLVRPTAAEMAGLFPAAASRANVAGSAKVSCVIQLDGTLGNCAILSEAPKGYGFGLATLNAARLYRIQPPTVVGQPLINSRYVLGVRFTRSPPASALRKPAADRPHRQGVGEAPADALGVESPASPPPSPTAPKSPLGRSPDLLWLPTGFAGAVILAMLGAWLLPSRPPKRRPRGAFA